MRDNPCVRHQRHSPARSPAVVGHRPTTRCRDARAAGTSPSPIGAVGVGMRTRWDADPEWAHAGAQKKAPRGAKSGRKLQRAINSATRMPVSRCVAAIATRAAEVPRLHGCSRGAGRRTRAFAITDHDDKQAADRKKPPARITRTGLGNRCQEDARGPVSVSPEDRDVVRRVL